MTSTSRTAIGWRLSSSVASPENVKGKTDQISRLKFKDSERAFPVRGSSLDEPCRKFTHLHTAAEFLLRAAAAETLHFIYFLLRDVINLLVFADTLLHPPVDKYCLSISAPTRDGSGFRALCFGSLKKNKNKNKKIQ